MKRYILALLLALGITAGGAATTSARAGMTVCTSSCGSITYNEYSTIGGGDSEPYIQDTLCNCHPTWVEYSQNSTYKTAIYNANNSTFYWDIRQIQIGYYRHSGGYWAVDYKGRIGCSSTSCNGATPALMVP